MEDKPDNTTPIGKFIISRRGILGLTQKDVAERLTSLGYEYSSPAVAHWENRTGKYAPPLDDPDFVSALARVLEVDRSEILTQSGLLEGLNMQEDGDILHATNLFREMSPKQRKTALDILKGFVGKQ